MTSFRFARTALGLRSLVFGVALLGAASCLAEDSAPAPVAEAAPPPSPTILIADLRSDSLPLYGYQSWEGKVAHAKDGAMVQGFKGAQGDGGFCSNPLGTPLDLSGAKYIEVALGLGATNEVPEFTVALADADGTTMSARLKVGQISPSQLVWLRVPVETMVPSTGEYAGKTPGMDWAKVTSWQLQGDWTTKKPAQVLFVAIRAHR